MMQNAMTRKAMMKGCAANAPTRPTGRGVSVGLVVVTEDKHIYHSITRLNIVVLIMEELPLLKGQKVRKMAFLLL